MVGRTPLGVYMAFTTFCLATDEAHARSLVHRLRSAGFTDFDVSVMMRETYEDDDFVTDPHIQLPLPPTEVDLPPDESGYAWLDGLGPVAVPGVGGMIVGGPILGGLHGPSARGTSGVAGALTTFGMSIPDARRFDARLLTGHILVAAHSETAARDEQARRALLGGGGMYLVSSPPAPSVAPRAQAPEPPAPRG